MFDLFCFLFPPPSDNFLSGMLNYASSYLAIGSGVDIIRSNAEQALSVSLGWEKFWEATYDKTNGLWLAVVYLSSVIVSFTFLGFSVSFLQSLWNNKYDVALKH